MTRKRFVKLLMCRRWTRNEAKEIAMNVYAYGRTKKTYAKQYRGICALELFGNNGGPEDGKEKT